MEPVTNIAGIPVNLIMKINTTYIVRTMVFLLLTIIAAHLFLGEPLASALFFVSRTKERRLCAMRIQRL